LNITVKTGNIFTYFDGYIQVKSMINQFLVNHPVFTTKQWEEYLNKQGSRSPRTIQTLLRYHQKQGHIRRLRRGLYAAIPPGSNLQDIQVDPFLVAASLAEDAVLAYHTALMFHGRAYSSRNIFTYLTKQKDQRRLKYQGVAYHPVAYPLALLRSDRENLGVQVVDRAGQNIRVTTLERTMVDVLDRPDLSGGWEEVWRSLESVPYFDLELVADYTLALENATTAAKVGFYLEQHKDVLMVDARTLDRLRMYRPKSPHYMSHDARARGRLFGQWNLIVPTEVVERSWEEII
jgi:predicted transcriptional regulator of viral defense system